MRFEPGDSVNLESLHPQSDTIMFILEYKPCVNACLWGNELYLIYDKPIPSDEGCIGYVPETITCAQDLPWYNYREQIHAIYI